MAKTTETEKDPPAQDPVIEFAREELAGKLMQMCVRQLEKQKNPWGMTSESHQAIALNAMRQATENAVRDAVMVIASARKPALYATVESVTFKDGIKATLTLAKELAGRHALADAAGHTVAIVIASPEELMGGTQKVKAQPDQKSLLKGDKVDDQALSYEIVPPSAGFKWRVLKDKVSLPGAPKGFETQAEAETWLQEHLQVGKHKPDGDPEAAPT